MTGQPLWQQVGGSAAEVYQRSLVPAMFAPWAPRLVERAGVRPGEYVLDVACGTGVVTRLAAERVGAGGRVIGLDFNAGMLGVARSLPPPPGATIEWYEADVLAMPLPDDEVDVVLCQHGLQQFPDRPAALRELRRVLHQDGRLAACVWGPVERSPGMAALVDALDRHVGAAAATNRRAPFALGDATELGELVDGAGFRDVTVHILTEVARFASPEELVEVQLAATPLSALGGVTDEARTAVARDVRAALSGFLDERGLAVPMQAHIVLAHA